jgi:hypothetical protein
MTTPDPPTEYTKCAASYLYFIIKYVYLYDAIISDWIPFDLWPAQVAALDTIHANQRTVMLKARQVGMTWCVLAYALWTMYFRPEATILLLSKRDDEAVDLLDYRLKGMHDRLPDWMREEVTDSSKHEWALANGSRAKAFPSTGGDSYTATLAIFDEFDLLDNQGTLLGAIKPTIGDGGKLVLLSRPDKSKPESRFKKIYTTAKQGLNKYAHVFLAWDDRPDRTPEWYDSEKQEIFSETGALDDLHEQYPANDIEALSARTLDKRLATQWIVQCYREMAPLPLDELPPGTPSLPGLKIYRPYEPGHAYIIGVDTAEGKKTSDNSALTVLDRHTGEECAAMADKIEPSVLAGYVDLIGRYYRGAEVMVERNNHGHAVIMWLFDNSDLEVLDGWDDNPGWNTTTKSKALLYVRAADAFRNRETILHSSDTQHELSSIEKSSLSAPDGQLDDRAVSYALCLAAIAVGEIEPARKSSWAGKKRKPTGIEKFLR